MDFEDLEGLNVYKFKNHRMDKTYADWHPKHAWQRKHWQIEYLAM